LLSFREDKAAAGHFIAMCDAGGHFDHRPRSETAIALPATSSRCLAILALSAAATGATAGPETCLTLRENSAVAQCANQYGPGRVADYNRDRPAAPNAHIAAARADDVLQTVPVPSKKGSSTEPAESFAFAGPDHYRFILNGMAISGIVGFVVLGVIGWLWRLRGASSKHCPYCSARVPSNAHVCKACFRVI
jgi:hypothetical protein